MFRLHMDSCGVLHRNPSQIGLLQVHVEYMGECKDLHMLMWNHSATFTCCGGTSTAKFAYQNLKIDLTPLDDDGNWGDCQNQISSIILSHKDKPILEFGGENLNIFYCFVSVKQLNPHSNSIFRYLPLP